MTICTTMYAGRYETLWLGLNLATVTGPPVPLT